MSKKKTFSSKENYIFSYFLKHSLLNSTAETEFNKDIHGLNLSKFLSILINNAK